MDHDHGGQSRPRQPPHQIAPDSQIEHQRPAHAGRSTQAPASAEADLALQHEGDQSQRQDQSEGQQAPNHCHGRRRGDDDRGEHGPSPGLPGGPRLKTPQWHGVRRGPRQVYESGDPGQTQGSGEQFELKVRGATRGFRVIGTDCHAEVGRIGQQPWCCLRPMESTPDQGRSILWKLPHGLVHHGPPGGVQCPAQHQGRGQSEPPEESEGTAEACIGKARHSVPGERLPSPSRPSGNRRSGTG